MRVGALDAIAQTSGSGSRLKDFVRENAVPSEGLDELVDYLWGRVHSAHFHGGEFPLGEFSAMRLMDPLMDSVETAQRELHWRCYRLIREVIVRWIDRELARSASADKGEDEQG